MSGPVAVGEDRRKRILDYLRLYIGQHGKAPSIREISDAAELASIAYTHAHLRRLEHEGFIVITPRRWRGIFLVDPAPDGWTKDSA